MKKLFAQIAAVLMLTAGITVVGGAANAEPAEAARMLQCRLIDAGPGRIMYGPSASGRYATMCWRDYGLDEEILLWWYAKDGYAVVNYRNVPCDRQYHVGGC